MSTPHITRRVIIRTTSVARSIALLRVLDSVSVKDCFLPSTLEADFLRTDLRIMIIRIAVNVRTGLVNISTIFVKENGFI